MAVLVYGDESGSVWLGLPFKLLLGMFSMQPLPIVRLLHVKVGLCYGNMQIWNL